MSLEYRVPFRVVTHPEPNSPSGFDLAGGLIFGPARPGGSDKFRTTMVASGRTRRMPNSVSLLFASLRFMD